MIGRTTLPEPDFYYSTRILKLCWRSGTVIKWSGRPADGTDVCPACGAPTPPPSERDYVVEKSILFSDLVDHGNVDYRGDDCFRVTRGDKRLPPRSVIMLPPTKVVVGTGVPT